MGKKRALRKRLSLIDKFEAELQSHVDEVESIDDDEEEIIVPICPYLTSIVTVLVGSPSKEFQVHSGVISESRVLASKCQSLFAWQKFSLPDIDASVFELALCYMYGKDYKDYFSPSNPAPRKSDARAAAFKRHSLVYCFARKYELDGLNALATKNIKDLGQVDYPSVFCAAKEAYKRFPDDESWFRDCFKVETRRALRVNHELFRESWILDTIAEGGGNFSLDLFTAMADRYEKIISRVRAVGPDPKSSPSLSRWFSPNLNRSGGTSSANSCSTDWKGQDTDFEDDSATDATSGDEMIGVEQSSCAEDYTPSEESPCLVAEYPEVEQAYPIEDAATAETSYPTEAAMGEEIAEVLEKALLEVEPAEKASEKPQIDIALAEEAAYDEEEAAQKEASSFIPQLLAETDAVSPFAEEVANDSGHPGPNHPHNWDPWGAWTSRKSKKDKKKRVQCLLTQEDDPRGEPTPQLVTSAEKQPLAEELPMPLEEKAAEAIPVEEVPIEEAPVDECAAAATVTYDMESLAAAADTNNLCVDPPVEYIRADHPGDAPCEPKLEFASETMPEPEPGIDPELDPVSAEEELSAEPPSEPLWSFSPMKKASKKGKKARVVFPSNPHPPSDTTTPVPELRPLHREDGSPPRDQPSLFGRRCFTLPVYSYASATDVVEDDAQPESSTCTSRGRHLANESRWINCAKCRAELNVVAQKMARECSAGWERFAR